MSRAERIEYEILACVLKADPGSGLATDVATFTARLQLIFPDLGPNEFVNACRRLRANGHLLLRQRVGDIARAFDGAAPMDWFSLGDLILVKTGSSHAHYQKLARWEDLPNSRLHRELTASRKRLHARV